MKKIVSTLGLLSLAVLSVASSSAQANCVCEEVRFNAEEGEIRLVRVPHDHHGRQELVEEFRYYGFESRNQAVFNCEGLITRHNKCL